MEERLMSIDPAKGPDLSGLIFRVFPEVSELIRQGLCSTCKKPINGFKDKISEREYGISGMCQSCQDATFEQFHI